MLAVSRLKVGVDVPWVTSWSAETVLGVGACPTVAGRPAVQQTERAGYGRPNYSANHFRRQRASVARMLCPMCGEPTSSGDRWTLTARRTAAGALRASGLEVHLPKRVPDDQVVLNAGAIAPLHRLCAERSNDQCPHLRAQPDLELTAFPERWVISPLWMDATPGPRGAHALLVRLPAPVLAIGFLQICGLTSDLAPHWRRSLQRQRRRHP